MTKSNKIGKGADVDDVAALHTLLVKGTVAQIKAAIEAGELTPALITAALKICSEANVTATAETVDETAELSEMVRGLNLDLSALNRYQVR